MNEKFPYDDKAQTIGYFPFMEPDEKTVFSVPGTLENLIGGFLVLTNKKLFFYFYSNITRDKKFIATYPYIISANLKEGMIYSTLIVSNKKEGFNINKIKKNDALKSYKILNEIIKSNKK
ncbi:MAG TPA: PH domain-containing protein [Candidatus Humimicrobiaceae bacterium]